MRDVSPAQGAAEEEAQRAGVLTWIVRSDGMG
jgi:hypothetical protein